MSRREDIENDIWDDPPFQALSPRATLLYLWSFTNPRCGMAGLYKVGYGAMTESKVALVELPAALAELAEAGFAFYEDHVLFVRTRVKHLRSRSPQMAQSIANDVAKVSPGHVLRARFFAEYGADPWLRERLTRTCADPIGNLSENPVNKPDSHTLSRPSLEGPGQGQGKKGTTDASNGRGKEPSRAVDQDSSPSSLPDELKAVLPEVLSLLETVQAERGGNRPSLRGVGLAIDAHRDRDHVAVARELQHWALAGSGQAKPVIDWARTYATFLKRSPAGSPVQAGKVLPFGRHESAGDMIDAIWRGAS